MDRADDRAAEAGIGDSASLTQITISSGFRRDDTSPTLDMDAVEEIASQPDVSAVVPILSLDGTIDLRASGLRGSGRVYGIYPSTTAYLGVDVAEGTLSLSASDPYGALIGASLQENFYDPDSDTYTAMEVALMGQDLEMRVYTQGTSYRSVTLEATGILSSGSSQDSSIFLPITTVIDLNERISGSEIDADDLVYDQILVQASSREMAGDVLDTLTELGYNASGMGSYLSQINDFFGTMRLMLTAVGGVPLLVAAFGVANTMTMAILERTREIGLMKAVGATDRAILTIFLSEAGMVGLIGGIAGLGLCYVFQYGVNSVLNSMGTTSDTISFMNATISVSDLGGNLIAIPAQLALIALTLAAYVGIAAGLYPAYRAARMTTVLALKSD
ncbi:ABC transporter permease [Aggregatilinea lenta]|uniref:ABC transporter permease n=1 Tax=Aggregatilinea lenta TaxID=913108 RepID=UPI000E5B4356|nr:ABC transporter permease [Aggregatilinea lenta]